MLRAALCDDQRERDRIISEELDGTWPFEVVAPAVALAALRRFDRWDRRAVLAFARQFVTRAPGGADFAVIDAEAVVRGATGDVHLLAATSNAENLPALYHALLLALADELDLDDTGVEVLLDEAVRETTKALELADPPGDVEMDPAMLRRYRRIHRRYLSDADMVPAPVTPPRPSTPLPVASGVDGYPEPASRAGRYLRSYLTGEDGPAASEASSMDHYLVARATLIEAIVRYLPPDPDLREITTLIRMTTETYPDLFSPMKAEYLVRILMGEKDVPLDGITKRDVHGATLLMLRVIGTASDDRDSVISPLLVAAEKRLMETGKRLTV